MLQTINKINYFPKGDCKDTQKKSITTEKLKNEK